jgi:hypothetical protein
VLAAQSRIGVLLQTLGVIDGSVPFDGLGLETLFVDDTTRRPRLPVLARLVCWFGARDPEFVRRPPWDPTEKALYVDYPRRCQALGRLRPRQGDPGGGMMRPPQLAAQEIEP